MDAPQRNNRRNGRSSPPELRNPPSGQRNFAASSSRSHSEEISGRSSPGFQGRNSPTFSPREQSTLKYYDPRYIILKTGQLNEEEVRKLIKSLITSVEKVLGHSLNHIGYEINVVRDTRLPGFDSYKKNTVVFFSNTTIPNILVGLNPDGSKRVEKQYIAPAPSPVISNVNLSSSTDENANGVPKKKSWADMAEEEDALEACYKDIPLPPLIQLPYIPYTGEALKWNLAQKDTEYKGIQVTAIPCFVMDPPEGFARHVLCYTGDCPHHITAEDIAKQFRPYATDSLTEVEFHFGGVNGKKEKFWSNYPAVRFVTVKNAKLGKEMRNVYVYFDRGTRDAAFALKMRKHFNIKGASLAFSHALTENTY